MTQKVDYKSLKDLTGEEILGKIKDKSLSVPKEERDTLVGFAQMDASKREDFLKGKYPEGDITQPKETPAATTGNFEIPQAPEPPKGEATPAHEPKTPEPKPGTEGYFTSASKQLMDDLLKKESQLKKQTATNSKLGRENKILRSELGEVKKQIADLKAVKEKEVDGNRPARPKLPRPKDFEDGVLDPAYAEAMEKYNDDIDVYENNLEAFSKSKEPEWFKPYADKLTKAEKAYEFSETRQQQEHEAFLNKSWEDMWNETMTLQKNLGLETTIDLRIINEYQQKVNNAFVKDANGKLVVDPVEAKQAESFLTNLSPKDKENYVKITKVVNNYFDFGEGYPRPMYPDLTKNAALLNAIERGGVDVSLFKPSSVSNQQRIDQLSAHQQKTENYAQPMSPAHMGSADPKLDSEQTQQEKMERLMEMNRTSRKNPAIMSDANFKTEFEKLRTELGMARK